MSYLSTVGDPVPNIPWKGPKSIAFHDTDQTPPTFSQQYDRFVMWKVPIYCVVLSYGEFIYQYAGWLGIFMFYATVWIFDDTLVEELQETVGPYKYLPVGFVWFICHLVMFLAQ
jgi:hypothetical protein